MLNRRRERLLISVMTAPVGTPKKALLPTHPEDDSGRHRIPKWFTEASDRGHLVKEGENVEKTFPLPRSPTLWTARSPNIPDIDACHAWTDGSFRKSAGLGWIITGDNIGAGPTIAQGAKTLGTRQTAFDAEIAAIKEVLKWFGTSPYLHMIIHSDSTSAISRAGQSGTGPGQQQARRIQSMVAQLPHQYQSAEITWVKGHAGTPGNERADALAGMAAERIAWSPFTSLAHLKLRISEKFQKNKQEWNDDPHHHGTEEIPPPPPKKSCMDQTRNAIARTAAQIRTGHWRSAVYFKRVRKRKDDKCWFCKEGAKMTRSHALLHYPNATLAAARVEAWEGRNPKGIGILLSSPRWESRLMRFLELSGVGRYVDGGVDEDQAHAEKMDEWIVWEAEEEGARRSPGL
jgi:ribonuclease HI